MASLPKLIVANKVAVMGFITVVVSLITICREFTYHQSRGALRADFELEREQNRMRAFDRNLELTLQAVDEHLALEQSFISALDKHFQFHPLDPKKSHNPQTSNARTSSEAVAAAHIAGTKGSASDKTRSMSPQLLRGSKSVVLETDTCHRQNNADYGGKVIKWGTRNLQNDPGKCCESCKSVKECNIWVWCPEAKGCGSERVHKECWLKSAPADDIPAMKAFSDPSIAWMSGALYDADSVAAEEDELDGEELAGEERLEALKNNKALPLVYLDVSIKGKALGRIKMVLFDKDAPLAAENFRALCTGEKGTVPKGKYGEGKPLHFTDAVFYQIVEGFNVQTGANTESIYGGTFKDDAGGLKLQHNRKGLLSMANSGPDSNTSHFSILMGPAHHLDGHYVVFGEVVEGFEIAQQINDLAKGKDNGMAGLEQGAVITGSGQLR